LIDSSRSIPEPSPQGLPPPDRFHGPHVEVFSRPGGGPAIREPLRRSRRFKVFAAVLLLILAGGSIWNFSRPAIYRAGASVLVEAPTGIGLGSGGVDVDLQNVSAQERVLLARDLLEETLERAAREDASVSSLDPETLRAMLTVQPTPETNLVELAATGSDPGQLATLVNAWVEVYLGRRQRQVQTDVAGSLARIQEEYDRLDAEKRQKTEALDDYRRANDIDTMEGEGNQAPARLRMLTDELNKSRADQVKAEAALDALDRAIARGEPVVPPDEQAGLEALQGQAADLRDKLAKLQKRYTRVYMENEPSLREIPKELEQLESLIESKLAEGKAFMRSQARQAVERAGREVARMQQQLAVARSEASRFTAKFARYERLKADLEDVDKLHREVEARLIDVKTKAPQEYPQVKVLEYAYPPRIPLYPHYWRDFAYNLGVAAVAALLSVLLLEFLSRRERDESEMLPLTGVRVLAGGGGGEALAQAPPAAELPSDRQGAIPRDDLPSLPGAVTRELLPAEVRALTELADPASRQLIGLLLNGLTPAECAALDESDIDQGRGLVRSPSDGREIPLSPVLAGELIGRKPVPLWSGASGAAEIDALVGRIGLLAHDAGLAQPQEVDAAALRHTYVCHLVRQGARLTEIERVIGAMSTAELARYGVYSPAGATKPLAAIDLGYPAFEARPGPG